MFPDAAIMKCPGAVLPDTFPDAAITVRGEVLPDTFLDVAVSVRGAVLPDTSPDAAISVPGDVLREIGVWILKPVFEFARPWLFWLEQRFSFGAVRSNLLSGCGRSHQVTTDLMVDAHLVLAQTCV